MVQSTNGDLWLNGQRGVARIPQAEFRQAMESHGGHIIEGRLFTQADVHGPAPFFYDLPTAARDGDGRLWFNTSGSLVYVDPSQLATQAPLPILSIGELLADGRRIELSNAIPAGTQTLRIGYFGSNLAAPEEVHYRYRLFGIDDGWQEVDERTEAVYTHLRPGHYTFEVSATSGDGIWTQPVTAKFLVKPAFYQTSGFRLSCVLCLLALCVLIYRWRVNSVFRRYQERAEERAEERVHMARDLHDTLLQGFQGLMLRFHVAAMRLPEESDTRDELEGALVRAEKIMVEGRNRVSLLRSDDLRGVSLRSALLAVCTELAGPGCPTSIVEDLKPENELKSLIKDEVYWIAREALTNAFRHANAKEVKVLLAYERREFRLTCEDNGCGLDEEIDKAGGRPGHYGLPGMCERARRVNAKLHYNSAPMQGTRIELTVPGHFAYASGNSLFSRLRSTFGAQA
jgi:signal transduction histidine kinase